MESKKEQSKYGILVDTFITRENLTAVDYQNKNNKPIKLEPGTLLTLDPSYQIKNKMYEFKVVDYSNQDNEALDCIYSCSEDLIEKIPEDIWPFIIAIPDPYIRLEFVKDREHCKEIVSLKEGTVVTVNGSIFKKENNFKGIIRYIGLVSEMGHGYYFILQLAHQSNVKSPQYDDSEYDYLTRYVSNCKRDDLLVVSANAIEKSQPPKKSRLEAIGSTILKTFANSNMDRKTTSFHKSFSQDSNRASKQLKSTDKPKNTYSESNLQQEYQNMYQNNYKHQSTSDDVDGCTNVKSEDMSQFVENHEKSLDRQHRHKKSNLDDNNKTFEKTKAQFSKKHRDLIVIDDAEIMELTKNESEVIVVDNPKECDLFDIINQSKSWPKGCEFAAFSNADKEHSKKLKKCSDRNDNANLTNSIPTPASPLPELNIGVESMVEVTADGCKDLYGVVKWYGYLPVAGTETLSFGVELDEQPDEKSFCATNGSYEGVQLFKCQRGKGIFVRVDQCLIDQRFLDNDEPHNTFNSKELNAKMFGNVECPIVPGILRSHKIYDLEQLDEFSGKFRGIQGHHNSCYLDATLFAMFAFTSVFDSLLYRPAEQKDISDYEEVRTVLREEIVNPLRSKLFVRADRVMKLRQLLERLSSVSGLTSEEKDPEEFLNSLLAQILQADPFLKFSSGQDAFFYQLFVEKDERVTFPTVQQLFHQSFLASNIKLKEVPSCLIIQMPRFGKNYKMYPRILPTQYLDVTEIIEDAPRQCTICGNLAEFECRECFDTLFTVLDGSGFCKQCAETIHAKRFTHSLKKISVSQDFNYKEFKSVPRVVMELFAVVCIETSHYVAFVKTGSGLGPWCFFDSMADRRGEQNGYNIPEIVSVPDLPQWLSENKLSKIDSAANDKTLPEHAKRLLCDAYMCMYQSTDVMMYR